MKVTLLLIYTDLVILFCGAVLGWFGFQWWRRRHPLPEPPRFQAVATGRRRMDCGDHFHEYPFMYVSVGDTQAEADEGIAKVLKNDKAFTPGKFSTVFMEEKNEA